MGNGWEKKKEKKRWREMKGLYDKGIRLKKRCESIREMNV